MDDFMNVLFDEHLESIMNKSKEHFAMNDKVYQYDMKHVSELKKRYQTLRLKKEERFVINDYIACLQTAGTRASELAYMAGIADTIKLLHHLNVINNIEK